MKTTTTLLLAMMLIVSAAAFSAEAGTKGAKTKIHSSPPKYTLTITQPVEGGKITPAGQTSDAPGTGVLSVAAETSRTLTMSPQPGYILASVTLDGAVIFNGTPPATDPNLHRNGRSQVYKYKFRTISASHTFTASFVRNVEVLWYLDADNDGYYAGSPVSAVFEPSTGYVREAMAGDCNDSDPSIRPTAVEVCGNAVDEDCDGVDEPCPVAWYLDADGDGYYSGDAVLSVDSPGDGYVPSAMAGDCDDASASINPAASEVCGNGMDDNCDGVSDEGCLEMGMGMSRLPDTGQDMCYDAYGSVMDCAGSGQDGAYSIHPMSFTDNADGTVGDDVTHLMWQQRDDGITRTWDNAVAYCENLLLAGYDDWRLPSRMELLTLVNFGLWRPAIDTAAFPGTSVSQSYWTSASQRSWGDVSPSYTYKIFFENGGIYHVSKGSTGLARCVRGEPLVFGDLSDNGDETVTDRASGLVWQKLADSDVQRDWDQRIQYCENLSLAGYTDWRLPNIKEFASIMDDRFFNPTIDQTYFSNATSNSYPSSTSSMTQPASALQMYFGLGYSESSPKYFNDASKPTYCVRGGQ